MKWVPLSLDNTKVIASQIDQVVNLFQTLSLQVRLEIGKTGSPQLTKRKKALKLLRQALQQRVNNLQEFVEQNSNDQRVTELKIQILKIHKCLHNYDMFIEKDSEKQSKDNGSLHEHQILNENHANGSENNLSQQAEDYINDLNENMNNNLAIHSDSVQSGNESRKEIKENKNAGSSHTHDFEANSESESTGSRVVTEDIPAEKQSPRRMMNDIREEIRRITMGSTDSSAFERMHNTKRHLDDHYAEVSPYMEEEPSPEPFYQDLFSGPVIVQMNRDDFEELQKKRDQHRNGFLTKGGGRLAYKRKRPVQDTEGMYITSRGPYIEPKDVNNWKPVEKSKWMSTRDFRTAGHQKEFYRDQRLPKYIGIGFNQPKPTKTFSWRATDKHKWVSAEDFKTA
eukprot:gb/GECH01005319.1/.p1 GENE.gb/GECH01005319.1/~~gb/GECH01005319.1/.p1  ORF type:complete len:397 (+),score=84.53 gb/GECH01005319.1/:1-1191(+)